jgi:hypothetical protein
MSKKRLKIPKGLSEAVSCINLRPKGKTMIYKTQKAKDCTTRIQLKPEIKSGDLEGSSVAPSLIFT